MQIRIGKNVPNNIWQRYVEPKPFESPWPMGVCACASARVRPTNEHTVHFIIICGYKFFGSRSCQNESILLRSAEPFIFFSFRYRFALRSTSIRLDSRFIATLSPYEYGLLECVYVWRASSCAICFVIIIFSCSPCQCLCSTKMLRFFLSLSLSSLPLFLPFFSADAGFFLIFFVVLWLYKRTNTKWWWHIALRKVLHSSNDKNRTKLP